MDNRPFKQISNPAGFTLIELLIALAIFSIGFMAIGALQISSLRNVSSSQNKTLAMQAINSEVALLKQTPLWQLTVWRGNTFVESPEFKGWTSSNPDTAVYGDYTVSWWVYDPQYIPNRWLPTPTSLLVSENVTVEVAATNEPKKILNTIDFSKYWVTFP